MPDPIADNLGFFLRERDHVRSDRVAIIDLWGGEERRLSYRQLEERTERAGALLQGLGLKPGDRLALLTGNRSEYLELFFGAMRAGIVPVPLNTRQPAQSLDYMLRDSGSVGAAVAPDAAPDAIGLVEALNLRVKVTLDEAKGGWAGYEQTPDAKLSPALSPDGIAFQPYTAGSTGRPKGVRLTHRGMLWSIRATERYWPTPPSAVGLVAVPLFHKNAMRGTIKPNLYAGAQAVIMPRFEARAFLETLARYRVTSAGGVPAIFAMLLKERERIRDLDLSHLKLFTLGSAVVPPEMVEALERAFAGVKVKESYGLTEGGGPMREPVSGAGGAPVPRGSCGVAAPEYEVKLIGPDGRESAGEGELWTRSPYVPDGYHNLPAVTREKIIDGWLRTGDVFRLDRDGFYYFLGRVDDMFSVGGENVYPKEVENLLFSHPAVRDACVVPIPHGVKGLVPAAAVAVHDGARVTPDELKAFCLARGPAYAHPRRILIVDEMPLSGAGKPDRKIIQERLGRSDAL